MSTISTTKSSTKSSPATMVGAAALCALAIAGIITAIMLAFGSHDAAAAPVGPTPAHSTAPTAAVESLQRQLAQLHYYDGPITGVMNTQTTQAIQYLQRDAHLPQTGKLDAATQTALSRFLAQGNNQMGN